MSKELKDYKVTYDTVPDYPNLAAWIAAARDEMLARQAEIFDAARAEGDLKTAALTLAIMKRLVRL